MRPPRGAATGFAAQAAQIDAAVEAAMATAMAMAVAVAAAAGPPAAPAMTPAAMMAAIKQFLIDVCSFSNTAATEITTNQGYDNLDELFLLDDKGTPDNLCTIVLSPPRTRLERLSRGL
jgi:hypothetical protein